ncbi:MAG: DUF2283 domain-containing protein [Nitrospiraceae bacterium]|nr:DUF2283 domain-containing protein [Nitrospiraceae bacterium]
MRLRYEPDRDALSLVFGDRRVAARELGEGVSAVFDEEGCLVEVVIENVTARAPGEDIFRQILIEGIAPFDSGDPLLIVPRLFKGTDLRDERE